MPDGPLAGNGVLGVVTAPHRGSWPLSPANETDNRVQTLWIGSNTFWSANTYGADGSGPGPGPSQPSGAPFPHCEVPYGQLSLGGITVQFHTPPGPLAYTASQSLCNGTISSTVAPPGPGAAAYVCHRTPSPCF